MRELIVWVDVETGGLDPDTDPLLEIAAIITTMEGEKVSPSFNKMLSIGNLSEVINNAPDNVREMHNTSGLWKDLWREKTYPLNVVDEKITNWLKENTKEEETLYFGGNSITLDRNFVKTYLPNFYKNLSYRSIDATSISLVLQSNLNIQRYSKKQKHRALSDVKEAIREYKHYLSCIKSDSEFFSETV